MTNCDGGLWELRFYHTSYPQAATLNRTVPPHSVVAVRAGLHHRLALSLLTAKTKTCRREGTQSFAGQKQFGVPSPRAAEPLGRSVVRQGTRIYNAILNGDLVRHFNLNAIGCVANDYSRQ